MQYSMYDFALQLDRENPVAENLQFRIVYISEDYTNMQLMIRTTYSAIALIMWMWYCTKVVCRVPMKEKKKLADENWHLLGLSLGLVFFNDPWYAVSILTPSPLARLFNIMSMTIFIAGLMVFWLR